MGIFFLETGTILSNFRNLDFNSFAGNSFHLILEKKHKILREKIITLEVGSVRCLFSLMQ